ncbi:hypothetical protein B0H11DRAFT_1911620 [Mycena galericulata]|nr:hypothetical protein B0H11DRAFT_1911620 [Mycena galericulata]
MHSCESNMLRNVSETSCRQLYRMILMRNPAFNGNPPSRETPPNGLIENPSGGTSRPPDQLIQINQHPIYAVNFGSGVIYGTDPGLIGPGQAAFGLPGRIRPGSFPGPYSTLFLKFGVVRRYWMMF